MAKNSDFIILCLTLFCLSLISPISATNAEISNIINHKHEKNPPKIKDEIGVWELKKGNISIKVTNYGATLLSVILPDKNGKLADVVLGYDSPKDYKNDSTYFGALVGRVANRIGGAKYTYEGKTFKLVPNEGKNILHGGPRGFSTHIWEVDQYYPKAPSPYVRLSYFSRDGEGGFPGNLKVRVTYRIVKENQLSVSMAAKALDKATPVNLAQHTYWNLGGHNSGNILDNDVQIFGSEITPVNNQLIPTGKFEKVKGTPYDFLESHAVGDKIKELPNGYDINYVLDAPKKSNRLHRVAVVKDKKSGRVMELRANKPGVQFYTANLLKHEKGKGGAVYGPHSAICLETQGFPDAVNHPNFPSVIVSPCENYKHHMLYTFSTIS